MKAPVRMIVDFVIVTPDHLRKIHFGLEKSLAPDETEVWAINLELLERSKPTTDFHTVGQTSVVVGQKDYEGARTIAEHGLCVAQQAQALVAGDTLKQFKRGEVSDEKLQRQVLRILQVE